MQHPYLLYPSLTLLHATNAVLEWGCVGVWVRLVVRVAQPKRSVVWWARWLSRAIFNVVQKPHNVFGEELSIVVSPKRPPPAPSAVWDQASVLDLAQILEGAVVGLESRAVSQAVKIGLEPTLAARVLLRTVIVHKFLYTVYVWRRATTQEVSLRSGYAKAYNPLKTPPSRQPSSVGLVLPYALGQTRGVTLSLVGRLTMRSLVPAALYLKSKALTAIQRSSVTSALVQAACGSSMLMPA